MLCKIYSLTFQFLRTNDQEYILYAKKKGIRKYFVMEKYLSSELERICQLSSLNNKITLLKWLKQWSFKQPEAVWVLFFGFFY